VVPDLESDLSLSQTLDIFKLLTDTYPRYIDSASREAVETLGVEIVRQDEVRDSKLGITEQVLGWVSSEVNRISKRARSVICLTTLRIFCFVLLTSCGHSSHAPNDIFVLLSWCSGLYIACLKSDRHFVSSPGWPMLVSSLATLLDLILNPSTRAKSSIQRSALVRTRRALRSVSSLAILAPRGF